ncbi:MAG: hypothetical protein IJU41_04090 [Clostridia bacterium]|nr:hypothetical protein [Clostridia bacterium]
MLNFQRLFAELYEYFHDKYFSPDLSGIRGYDASRLAEMLPLLVCGLALGAYLAILYGYYCQHHLGKLVRTLLAREIDTPEAAQTLRDLGFAKPSYLRNLQRSSVLSKTLSTREEIGEKKSRAEILAAHYYIKEENKASARTRFKEMRGGRPMLIVWLIVCTAACFFLLYFLPDVLQLIDNAVGMI